MLCTPLAAEVEIQRSLQDARKCSADGARISSLKSGLLPALTGSLQVDPAEWWPTVLYQTVRYV
jgi:hypothetical protein